VLLIVSMRLSLPSDLVVQLACHWLSAVCEEDDSSAFTDVVSLVSGVHASHVGVGGDAAAAWLHVCRTGLVAAACAVLSLGGSADGDGEGRGTARGRLLGALGCTGVPSGTRVRATVEEATGGVDVPCPCDTALAGMVWLVLCCSARECRWDGALRGEVLSCGASSGTCGAGLIGVVCDGVRDVSFGGGMVDGGGAARVCVLGRGCMVLHRYAGQRQGEAEVGRMGSTRPT
jgi:hypothetical protein